jgi:hypothetical protein
LAGRLGELIGSPVTLFEPDADDHDYVNPFVQNTQTTKNLLGILPLVLIAKHF